MSQRELDRYDIIQRCLRKTITVVKAAGLLHLCTRQVKRLKKTLRDRGAAGLIHGNRGKASNRRIPDDELQSIVSIITKEYPDFGPTLATEHLHHDHHIIRHKETIRQIMIDANLWKPATPTCRTVHRAWRPRRACVGELVQFDGSYHHWLEDREGTGELCLIAAIDDASGRIMHAVFGADEGVFAVFGFWKGYVERHGRPRAVYCDKFSTYKQHILSAAEVDRKTQFQRAIASLEIEPIFAESPEAKGRVERLFQTLQDRLVKEMRLKNIATIAEANRYLLEVFIPWFNKRFAVVPASTEDLHRPLTHKERGCLDSVFARHDQHTVQNDFTIAHHKQWYQLVEKQPVTVCKKNKVTVEEWVDHSIHFRLRGKELSYKILPARPKKTATAAIPWVLTTTTPERSPAPSWKPAADHPWRQYAAIGHALKEQKR